MSDWQDFCDSQGIPNDENAIDHLISILDADESNSSKQTRHSDKSRPSSLNSILEIAFNKAGVNDIKQHSVRDWSTRLLIDTNKLLDVYHNHPGKITAFHFLPSSGWTEESKGKVRVALQVCLSQSAKPSEQGLWPKNQWKELLEFVNKEYPSEMTIDINHAPKTTKLNAIGFLPDLDGVVSSVQKMHCEILIKYGENRIKEIEKIEGDQDMCSYIITLLKLVGITSENYDK
jgi:hypothetical protein